jgi:hypothetical protein
MSPGVGVTVNGERIVRIEGRIDELEKDVAAVIREVGVIGGGPERKPLGVRVHALENNDRAAVLLAQAAKDFRQGRNDAWSTWLKVLVTGAAIVGALGTVKDMIA